MEATLALPGDATASLRCDMGCPNKYGFIPDPFPPKFVVRAEGELGSVELVNFVLPSIYHSITVKSNGRGERLEKAYKGHKGSEWWLSYRYQMEALVDRIRKRQAETWVSAEDSVGTMKWIEEIYGKVRKLAGWV